MGKEKREREKTMNDRAIEQLQKKLKEAHEKLERVIADQRNKKENKSESDNSSSDNDSAGSDGHNEQEDTEPEYEPVESEPDDGENTENIPKDQIPTESKNPDETNQPDLSIESPLDTELADAIGDDPSKPKSQKIQLHPEINNRWNHWFKQGMKKDQRQELLDKYGGIDNIQVPELNPEIMLEVPKHIKTKEKYMFLRQKTANAALASLGKTEG